MNSPQGALVNTNAWPVVNWPLSVSFASKRAQQVVAVQSPALCQMTARISHWFLPLSPVVGDNI